MANNRLYIGNKITQEYICLCKDDTFWWRDVNVDQLVNLNRILGTDDAFDATNLIFFTEQDHDLHDSFMDKGKYIGESKSETIYIKK